MNYKNLFDSIQKEDKIIQSIIHEISFAIYLNKDHLLVSIDDIENSIIKEFEQRGIDAKYIPQLDQYKITWT